MRAACIAVLFAAGLAAGQTAGPYEAVVLDTVTVRAGPGTQLDDTGELFRGTRVTVDHDEGEWAAVRDCPGQLGWVNHKFLKPVPGQPAESPRNMLVSADPDAEVAAGKVGVNRPLGVRKTRVPDGTVVLVVGAKVEVDGSYWYPVVPPAGDLRYVKRTALQEVRAEQVRKFVVREVKEADAPPPTAKPTAPFDPGPVSIPNTPSPPRRAEPASTHPWWQNAEQAERDGDYLKAEEWYLKLAAEMNRPNGDPDLANKCYARVHAVRERQRNRGRPAAEDRGPGGSAGGRSTAVGMLRLAGFKYDGRDTFAVLDKNNDVVCYAVDGPGVELRRYVRSEVELTGTAAYDGQARTKVMTVTGLRPVR